MDYEKYAWIITATNLIASFVLLIRMLIQDKASRKLIMTMTKTLNEMEKDALILKSRRERMKKGKENESNSN